MNEIKLNQRLSNIELLRIILTFVIIYSHVSLFGVVNNGLWSNGLFFRPCHKNCVNGRG